MWRSKLPREVKTAVAGLALKPDQLEATLRLADSVYSSLQAPLAAAIATVDEVAAVRNTGRGTTPVPRPRTNPPRQPEITKPQILTDPARVARDTRTVHRKTVAVFIGNTGNRHITAEIQQNARGKISLHHQRTDLLLIIDENHPSLTFFLICY